MYATTVSVCPMDFQAIIPTINTMRDFFFFFFQAEDGIRDVAVTGVQTCALPISFGRHHAVPAGIPKENGLSQTRARGKQRACAAGLGLARIQNAEIFRGKMLEAMPPRAEVIEEHNVRNVQLLDERFGFHDPGEVRGAHAAVDDRTGDAKSGSVNSLAAEMIRSLAGKLLDDQIELRKFLAGKAVAKNRRQVSILFGK